MLFTRVLFALPLLATAWAAPSAPAEERALKVPDLTKPLSILSGVQAALTGPLALIKANPTDSVNVAAQLADVNTILAPVEGLLKGALPAPAGGLGGLLGGLLGGGSTLPSGALQPVADLLARILAQILGTTSLIPGDVLAEPPVTSQLGDLSSTLAGLLATVESLLKGVLALVTRLLAGLTGAGGNPLDGLLSGLLGGAGLGSLLGGFTGVLNP